MATGTINRTICLLRDALKMLDVILPLGELEFIGVMVNGAMSAQERLFHTPEHIFNLADSENPHNALAALFHDIVYYHVDHGFTAEIEKILDPYITIEDGDITIVESLDPADRAFWGTAAVFGFTTGQKISPYGGLNEFLSSLVMSSKLEGLVSDKDLLITTACIEATIPFRGNNSEGFSPAVALEHRLTATADLFGLGLSTQVIQEAVKSAVTFANKDVRNFSEDDVGRFLDNTWKLLPETNPSLRLKGMYSVRNYRTALQKMEGFLSTLDPDTIFSRYMDTPPEEEYRRIYDLARRNVSMACEYLGIKLLTAAVLEAFAELSGGDTPVSMFMGDLNAKEKGSSLCDYLPVAETNSDLPIDKTLFDLLAYGRASASSFDLNNAPLAVFIYINLGTEGFHSHLVIAKSMFKGESTPLQFVAGLPRSLSSSIGKACGEMAFTRKAKIDAGYSQTMRKRSNLLPYRGAKVKL